MSPGRILFASIALAAAAVPAWSQDQQLGARTKAMGGSYTAFEDDPVSVWLNPAGIATQADAASLAYQTYSVYPVDQERGAADSIAFSVEPESAMASPGFWPSYLGAVFQIGDESSPMAVGFCIARPYFLSYAMDQIDDPLQSSFDPDSNVEQSFLRFRAAFAKDFLFKPIGTPGFFTHLSVGVGLDIAYEQWSFSGPTDERTDTSTGFGGGIGILIGVYDDTDSFKLNLGVAVQSEVTFDFDIEPDVLPAFDMPRQLNMGVTAYFLPGLPLRVTIDVQLVDWEATAENPVFPGHSGFENAVNFSMGAEYRVKAGEKINLFPRFGLRMFDAPWDDKDDLPSTGTFKLVLDTDDESFLIVTLGLGIGWTTADGQSRSFDVAADFGGDSVNFAVGYTHQF